jgi:hypothetical protein
VQTSDSCRMLGSADFPGSYAIAEGATVRRITLFDPSPVKLAGGIGIGATEAAVRAAYPGLVQTPHNYVEAPAKNLTTPDASVGKPALRFEFGSDGKVSFIHAGMEPVLGYSEACA